MLITPGSSISFVVLVIKYCRSHRPGYEVCTEGESQCCQQFQREHALTHDRLRALEERTKPPKEDENQDLIAQTYSQLGGFNNMLMLENAPGGGMPGMPPQHGGGIDMRKPMLGNVNCNQV
eukprot:g9076.t1 g9076   contig34:793302-794146(-)